MAHKFFAESSSGTKKDVSFDKGLFWFKKWFLDWVVNFLCAITILHPSLFSLQRHIFSHLALFSMASINNELAENATEWSMPFLLAPMLMSLAICWDRVMCDSERKHCLATGWDVLARHRSQLYNCITHT